MTSNEEIVGGSYIAMTDDIISVAYLEHGYKISNRIGVNGRIQFDGETLFYKVTHTYRDNFLSMLDKKKQIEHIKLLRLNEISL